MGLFDDAWNFIGGSKSASSTNSNSTQTSTQNQKTSQTQNQQATSLTSTLDPQTRAILTQLLQGQAGGVASPGQVSPDVAALHQIADQFSTRANTDISSQIVAAQAEAKRQFALNEGSQISQTQNLIGSKGNTFSELLGTQGNVDLSTSLAKVASDTLLQGRQLGDQELAQAMQAILGSGQLGVTEAAAPIQNVIAIGDLLKGSVVSQQSDVTSQLSQLIDMLGTVHTVGSSSTKGKDSPGLLQTFEALGKQ